jgi:hypothetical protein
MPISPATVPQLQFYLKDTSTESNLLVFYQSLLDAVTNKISAYLDRDFTSVTPKQDVFWGDGSDMHRLHNAASGISSWTYKDLDGNIDTGSNTALVLFEEGRLVRNKVNIFQEGFEYTITYALASTSWPEAVVQVIIEDAAILFNESNQGSGSLGELIASSHDGQFSDRIRYSDLTEAHEKILRMYKRYPV